MPATVSITAFEPPPQAPTCRLLLDRPVVPGARVGYSSREEAAGQGVFERLLEIPGVQAVAAEHDTILLWREPAATWPGILEAARWAVRDWFERSGPPQATSPEGETREDRESRIRAVVDDVLATSVNPGIAAHGGEIVLLDVKDTVVYVEMRGGCQGCGMSSLTLKRGLASAVRARAPDVTEFLDTTDHAAGTNPYYRRPGAPG